MRVALAVSCQQFADARRVDRPVNRAHHPTLLGKSYRLLQRPDRATSLAQEMTSS